jgi:hypothetical protein
VWVTIKEHQTLKHKANAMVSLDSRAQGVPSKNKYNSRKGSKISGMHVHQPPK